MVVLYISIIDYFSVFDVLQSVDIVQYTDEEYEKYLADPVGIKSGFS